MTVDTGAPAATKTTAEVQYRTEAVKVVRGMENITIAKRESDGWELVSQQRGKVRTELHFRRPKPKVPWRLYAILGGVLAVLFIFIGIMSTINGGGEADAAPTSAPSNETVAEDTEPPTGPEEEATSAEAEPGADDASVVTTTVDELLNRLNSADMGGIVNGDRFKLTGELFMSDMWMTGATGDYFVLLKALDGAQDLTVFVEQSTTAGWTDGTVVEFVLESGEATIDGETTDGWLRVISAEKIS